MSEMTVQEAIKLVEDAFYCIQTERCYNEAGQKENQNEMHKVIALLEQGELNKIYKDAWWKSEQDISDEIEKEEPEEGPEYYSLLMSKNFREVFLKAMEEKHKKEAKDE